MSDVRLAQPDDAEAIHLILQETWGESLLFDVFADHISSPEHQVFVAVEAGEVVGFLSAFLVSNLIFGQETQSFRFGRNACSCTFSLTFVVQCGIILISRWQAYEALLLGNVLASHFVGDKGEMRDIP